MDNVIQLESGVDNAEPMAVTAESEWPWRDYWMKKFPILEFFKKDIQQRIISTINEGALKFSFAAAPAIWQRKQMGEKDTMYQDGKLEKTHVVLTEEERDAKIKKLEQKLKG